MSLTTDLAPALEGRLPKVINAKTHGFIDYGHAAFFLALGLFLLKSNKRAAAAALSTSALVIVQSLLTDYPLGVKPVLSFKQHGRIDAAFASTSWLLPRIFGFAGTGPAAIFEVNTLIEGSVVALTDFSSAHARAEQA